MRGEKSIVMALHGLCRSSDPADVLLVLLDERRCRGIDRGFRKWLVDLYQPPDRQYGKLVLPKSGLHGVILESSLNNVTRKGLSLAMRDYLSYQRPLRRLGICDVRAEVSFIDDEATRDHVFENLRERALSQLRIRDQELGKIESAVRTRLEIWLKLSNRDYKLKRRNVAGEVLHSLWIRKSLATEWGLPTNMGWCSIEEIDATLTILLQARGITEFGPH